MAIPSRHASRTAPQRHRAPDSAAGAGGKTGQDTLLLLLPVKRASDIIYGARHRTRPMACPGTTLAHAMRWTWPRSR